MRDFSLFTTGLKELNISLSDEQLSMFEKYYDMLVEKNKVMNLTGITEWEDVLVKHFLDSLSIVKSKHASDLLEDGAQVLDVGTGAGFPGIPLSIAFPSSRFILMDSLNKRINFLSEVVKELNINNVKPVHARCEELARKSDYREMFDLSVSRAVAKTNSLSEMCLPFVRVGGYFIPYKSGVIDEELENAKSAFSKLGGTVKDIIKFTVPCSDYERSLIVTEKISKTPSQYPRMGGKILDKPL